MSISTFGTLILATKGPDPEDVTAGWAGFLLFIGLAVAVVLLWLSFRKQLKKIDFEEEPDEPAPQKSDPQISDSEPHPGGATDPPEQRES